MALSISTARAYYWLAKPGIVYGNTIALLAGFFFASSLMHMLDMLRLLATVIGTSLVIGSSCVVNNFIDRRIDKKMKRTKRRALVSGKISPVHAVMYAAILGVCGFLILVLLVNFLTALVGLAGYIFYVMIYGIAKRHTPFSTLIGSVAGAAPPVAGYVAVTNELDGAALVLFLILAVWQMPHFYAIAIRRREEYAAAGLPVLTVARGDEVTRRRILGYLVLYILVTPLLYFFGAGYSYLVLSVGVSLIWLILTLRYWSLPAENWAKKVFLISLGVLIAQSFIISIGAILP